MPSYDYLISARQINGKVFGGEPGPLSYIKIPSTSKSYDTSHIVKKKKKWAREIQGLADGDENPNSISPTGDVLIFVHGYNNDIPIVLKRMRQLRRDLQAEGWRGEVIAFDWPSENSTLNYLEDRADAAKVAHSLVTEGIDLLIQKQKNGCSTNIHLLGHSTGAYVIMEAFAQAEKVGAYFKSDWRVGQVALIGADVSTNSLNLTSDWSKPMFRRIMRLTNYSNPFDSVLAVSNAKRLGTSPRVGRHGLPDSHDRKAVNVDCGDHFKSLDPDGQPHFGSWPHSWHIGDRVFARDLAMALEGAIDRNAIPTRRKTEAGLSLQDAPRPQFMPHWDIKEGVRPIA
ncbi:alpha/beta fold hydrolase [Stappia sp. GBMRC 2046]|uniref:Alpha/beta fold hydrolase n=1 Tax=Stappia sediminis TaxID=2692190 RepID=A0A7X3LX47_9HYPH|nr:alpha/beta fold hydrolase [Stappia sediminis]MXN66744.1 alpha/beta fold hydrolase [Stappia sediminis]